MVCAFTYFYHIKMLTNREHFPSPARFSLSFWRMAELRWPRSFTRTLFWHLPVTGKAAKNDLFMVSQWVNYDKSLICMPFGDDSPKKIIGRSEVVTVGILKRCE